MAITIQDIAKLRKLSGAGLTDCKKALEESNGDIEKAMEIIRTKGKAVAAKRSDREAAEGCVLAAAQKGFAAIVALQCETDFVAKNQGHIDLTQAILDAAMKHHPKTKEDLLATVIKDARPVADHITDRIGSTGEKMELGYYEFLEAEHTVSYIHPGNKLAVIVSFNEEVDERMARDIAMQVASMNPVSIDEKSVPQAIIDEELKIARDKAREAGKPEQLLDRIAEGSLQKYYKENTLVHQAFIKDNKLSIADYLKQGSKTLQVTAFRRVNLNEE